MGSENQQQFQENLLHNHQEQEQQQQRKNRSLRSKAAHFVSDVATVILNPISDKPLKPRPPPLPEDGSDSDGSKHESNAEGDAKDLVDGPDTSSFSAFLYSLLSTTVSESKPNTSGKYDKQDDRDESIPELTMREPSRRKGILSRGKHSLGRALHQVARLGGFRNQGSAKGSSEMVFDDGSNSKVSGDNQIPLEDMNKKPLLNNLPETSEPSVLLNEKARIYLYAALPVLVQDRKWVLLYRQGS
uniref:TLD family protein n=1 Tax=Solanum tuberosum TaxID=4113 RepID=M0ZNX2_SOLTU